MRSKPRPTIVYVVCARPKRPVTLTHGTNRLLGLRPDRIGEIPELLARATTNLRVPEGWDGHAATRVADVLVGDLIEAGTPSYTSPALIERAAIGARR